MDKEEFAQMVAQQEDSGLTFKELVKKYPHRTYNELTKVQKEASLSKEAKKGVCITGALKKDLSRGKEIDYHRYWKDMYEKEHKLRQEAQGETTIVKGIGMSSPEMKEAKERIKELENSLAVALEINESHQKYNGKLQTRLTDVEEDNRKLNKQINDHIKSREDAIRKAGM